MLQAPNKCYFKMELCLWFFFSFFGFKTSLRNHRATEKTSLFPMCFYNTLVITLSGTKDEKI